VPKVLYIGGMGRSGSTLLELVLSRAEGFCPVGELRYLFERGPGENVLCACGERFLACPFWTAVGERAFGGWQALDVDDVLGLWSTVDRHRYIPALIRPRGGVASRLARYGQLLSQLYEAIGHVSGARVIVDATKDPPYAFVLRHVAGLDLRLVHLVRDSRGVAYSWTKRVVRPEVIGREALMRRVAPPKMALLWLDYNALCHLLGGLGVPRLRIRYEDFVRAPSDTLTRVFEHVGEQPQPLPIEDGAFEPAVVHTISGNPIRFGSSRVSFSLDDAWRTRFDPRSRRLVTAMTWPLLVRYGYPIRVAHER
jgi:Sulfotransferase family